MTSAEEVQIDIGDTPVKEAVAYYISAAPDTEITPVNIGCFEGNTAKAENGRFTLPPRPYQKYKYK